jgi:uncharacterized damage-inducible protein DinB
MRTVRRNTLVIAEDIPEASYPYQPTAESRSVSELLLHIGAVWQITYQIQEIERRASIADFDFRSFLQKPTINEQRSASKNEIISFLRSEGERLSKWVEELREPFLTESVQMPPNSHPATKSRFEMILGAKEHEMHHRAQLMVVQRLLGIVPDLSRNRQEPAAGAARATT